MSSSAIKIALFTDTHLGFASSTMSSSVSHENYLILEECLCLANTMGADVILHAGDLFNQSRLSSKKVLQAIQTLKAYNISTFANNSKSIFTGNASKPIPMALIYGNHDGNDRILNLLEEAGVANLLKSTQQNKDITLYPLCYELGAVELVIYGLDYCKMYLRRTKPTLFFEPPKASTCVRYTFLLLHQDHSNQVGREKIDLSFVDDWNNKHDPARRIDFVYIGHEHDESQPSNGSTYTLLMPGSPHRQARKGSLNNVYSEDSNFYLLSLQLNRSNFSDPPLKFCQLDRYQLLSGNFYHKSEPIINILIENFFDIRSKKIVQWDDSSYKSVKKFIEARIEKEVQEVSNCARKLLFKRIQPKLSLLSKYCTQSYKVGYTIEKLVDNLASLTFSPSLVQGSHSAYSIIAYLRYYIRRQTVMEESPLKSSDCWSSLNPAPFRTLLCNLVSGILGSSQECLESLSLSSNKSRQSLLESISRNISDEAIESAISSTHMFTQTIPLPMINARLSFQGIFTTKNTASVCPGLIAQICKEFRLAFDQPVDICSIQRKYAHVYMNGTSFIDFAVSDRTQVDMSQQDDGLQGVVCNREDNSCISILINELNVFYKQIIDEAQKNALPELNGSVASTQNIYVEPYNKRTTPSLSSSMSQDASGDVKAKQPIIDPTDATDQQHAFYMSDSNILSLLCLKPGLLNMLYYEEDIDTKEYGPGKTESTAKQSSNVRENCITNLSKEFSSRYSAAVAAIWESDLFNTENSPALVSNCYLKAFDEAESEYLSSLLRAELD